MKLLIQTTILASALFLASCGEKNETATSSDTAQGTADYPLTTCVVSGKELGSMGDPIIVEHKGTQVKLCCKHCTPKFEQDPAKYAAMVKKGAE